MTRWRLWCNGCTEEDQAEEDQTQRIIEWIKAHQHHGLGGFVTPQQSDG